MPSNSEKLQRFSELRPKPDSVAVKPLVVSPHSISHKTEKLLTNAEYYNPVPYQEAMSELTELQGFYQTSLSKLPTAAKKSPEALKAHVINSLMTRAMNQADSFKVEEVTAIFANYTYVFRDLLAFAKHLNAAQGLVKRNADTRLIYWPDTKEITRYVVPSIHRVLQRSRMLGLHDFADLDRLTTAKIVVIGSSVAAQTADLLVSIGAQNLEVIDPDTTKVSNGPRLTTTMAHVRNQGLHKADQLLAGLYGREPFGNFLAHKKKVTLGKSNDTELVLGELVAGADVIIEVIDNPIVKIQIHDYLQEQFASKTLFLADISPVPIVGVENEQGKLFNQSYNTQDWLSKLQLLANSNPLRQKALALNLITEMLGSNITERHLISTSLIAVGLQPFLAQSPSDSRVNAAVATEATLAVLRGDQMTGRTVSMWDLEREYVASEVNRHTMLKILQAVLQNG